MQKKNHDRFKFSYSVPAQSGLVERLNSTPTKLLVGKISKNKQNTKCEIVSQLGIVRSNMQGRYRSRCHLHLNS